MKEETVEDIKKKIAWYKSEMIVQTTKGFAFLSIAVYFAILAIAEINLKSNRDLEHVKDERTGAECYIYQGALSCVSRSINIGIPPAFISPKN